MTQTPEPPVHVEPPTYQPDETQQKASKAMAITAFVLAFCTIIPCLGIICGIIAIILGIVALSKKNPGKGFAIAAIVLPIILISVMLPLLNHARELSVRPVCLANLNGTGKGIIIYMADNEDAVPTIQDLIDARYISERMFKCPSSGDSERKFDYFYLPSEMYYDETPPDAPPPAIVACDYQENHNGEYRSVLYADCHVEGMSEEQFQQTLAQPQNAAFAEALRAAEGP